MDEVVLAKAPMKIKATIWVAITTNENINIVNVIFVNISFQCYSFKLVVLIKLFRSMIAIEMINSFIKIDNYHDLSLCQYRSLV